MGKLMFDEGKAANRTFINCKGRHLSYIQYTQRY